MNTIYSKQCEAVGGFNITFEALAEHTKLEETFDSSVDNIEQLYSDIESGKYVYFCARVSASKHGIELGADYLGCCLYESFEQFEQDAYFGDMVDSAISEAKQAIAKLAEQEVIV
jgi:hypothetical protein